jgi:hypothetical protein
MASKDSKGEVTPKPENQAGRQKNGLNPLHEVAMRLAAMGMPRSKGRTRELVSMLLGHGARAWRAGQPVARMHLHVTAPTGRHPVRLRIR